MTLSEPYPFGHASGRWYYVLLKELRKRGNEVRCLSASTNAEWARLAREMVEPLGVTLSLYPVSTDVGWLRRKWRTLRQPFSYTLSDCLRRDLRVELARGYDILHLEQLWAGYLADETRASLVVIHHLGLIDLNQKFLHLSLAGDAFRRLMLRAERRLIQRLEAVSTLSDRLANAISEINPQAKVFKVPFAIEPSLYTFREEDRHREPVVGFFANMQWTPGYTAARRLVSRVFPLVKQQVPEARLLLGGWHARAALGEYLEVPDVTIIENVPDTKSYFERLQAFVYPVQQGSGVKVKVLEAMAWGIPVVTTTDGIEGIGATDGVHCLIADGDEEFASKVRALLRDTELRRTLRQRARALVEEQHSPVPALDQLERVYDLL